MNVLKRMVSAHESPKPDGGKSLRGADIDGLTFESGRGDLLTGGSGFASFQKSRSLVKKRGKDVPGNQLPAAGRRTRRTWSICILYVPNPSATPMTIYLDEYRKKGLPGNTF